MIKKAIIPMAGLGTRLLSLTKEQPKEMLPLFTTNTSGELCLKPISQLVFEQLFNENIREFCFIVGRGKRVIEDHFTPDHNFVDRLFSKNKENQALELEKFYKMLNESKIVWINQAEPKGFGDAVLQVKNLIQTDSHFLVHAGDTYIISNNNLHLKRIIQHTSKSKTEVVLMTQKVNNPTDYGIIQGKHFKDKIEISGVEEKPLNPKTNFAIMPIYVFTPLIFKAIESLTPGIGGEIQLTDAIQKIIDWDKKTEGLILDQNDVCLDIGTPNLFYDSQVKSFKLSSNQNL